MTLVGPEIDQLKHIVSTSNPVPLREEVRNLDSELDRLTNGRETLKTELAQVQQELASEESGWSYLVADYLINGDEEPPADNRVTGLRKREQLLMAGLPVIETRIKDAEELRRKKYYLLEREEAPARYLEAMEELHAYQPTSSREQKFPAVLKATYISCASNAGRLERAKRYLQGTLEPELRQKARSLRG